jgi:hypothetical protein
LKPKGGGSVLARARPPSGAELGELAAADEVDGVAGDPGPGADSGRDPDGDADPDADPEPAPTPPAGDGHPNADGVMPGKPGTPSLSSTAVLAGLGADDERCEPARNGLAWAAGANALRCGVEGGAPRRLGRCGDPASSSGPAGSDGCACASELSVMGGSSRVV